MGQSEGISNYNFMSECDDIDFYRNLVRACSCHVVNTHNVVTHEAFGKRLHKNCHLNCFIDKKVCTIYGEVYAEDSGGH